MNFISLVLVQNPMGYVNETFEKVCHQWEISLKGAEMVSTRPQNGNWEVTKAAFVLPALWGVKKSRSTKIEV